MSLIISNTTGQITFDYRVEISRTDFITSASLLIKLPNVDEYTFYDCMNGVDSSSADALEMALKRGSKKWGIELLTLKSKVA